MRQLYAIEWGARRLDNDARVSSLGILLAGSIEDARNKSFDKAHRDFPERDGYYEHFIRTDAGHELQEIVKFMDTGMK